MKAGIFTLWITHRTRPADDHYAYFVFPNASEQNIEARAAVLDVITNTAALQVVEDKKHTRAGFVFFEPGEATTRLFGKINTDKPCVLMITQQLAAQHISVADPTQRLGSIVIGLTGKKTCSNAAAVYDTARNQTFLSVSLPAGPEAGKTVTLIVQ